MTVRDQLTRLLRVQELVLEIREAQSIVEGAPARVEEIERQFRERNAEYVGIRERHEAVQADQRTRTEELDALDEQRKKYMDDLMQVTNQREYAAMLREIDVVKATISGHEEAILKDMEELEGLNKDLETHESHIREERVRVEHEAQTVQAEADAARRRIAEHEEERRRLESELPREVVDIVGRLESGRQGIFLAQAVDGICQSCFVRVRPQVFQEIKLAVQLHACASCRRLLYNEAALKPRERGAEGGSHDSPGIEAINGGAV